MLKLIMLCGLPGTGKSHIRKMYDPVDWRILSSDDIIEEMCAADSLTYSEGFPKFVKEATKRLEEKIVEFQNSNVIWDQTNLTRKVRIQKLLKFPNHEKHAIIVIPKSTDDVMVDMYKYRPDKVIPRSIVENMAQSFEYPVILEGFSTITHYSTGQLFGENL